MLILLILIILLIYTEFNTKYIIRNEIKIKSGSLIVCSHDYEHKDIFITLQEIEKEKKEHFYVLFANEYWNYLIEPFRPNNTEFIYVKDNTVNKLSNKLILGYNVVLFLYKQNNSSGVYHILKNTNANLGLFKIKGNLIGSNHYNSSHFGILLDNKLSKYSLKYRDYNYSLNYSPKIFMNKLKNKLYS